VDSDGDGVSNSAEYIAGTDPLDPNSVFDFRITDDADWRVAWNSQNRREYRLERSRDLQNWQTVGDWVIGAGKPMSIALSSGMDGFFRLAVRLR
jgi:hypothetical protein